LWDFLLLVRRRCNLEYNTETLPNPISFEKIKFVETLETMTVTAIRKKLITYIADANEKKVKGLYMLVEDEISKNEKFKLSAAQLKSLEQDREKHVKGKSKSYSWPEAKNIIRGKAKL
jgi:hypothetical protein